MHPCVFLIEQAGMIVTMVNPGIFLLEKHETLRDGRELFLRGPRLTDVLGLMEIRRQVIEEGISNVDDTLPTPEKIIESTLTEKPGNLTLIADYQGEAVGALKLIRGDMSFLQHHLFLSIEIDRMFRGSGLGTSLMTHGAAWARHHGYEFIRLGVFDSNPRAVALYERLGYSEYGRLPRFVKKPDGCYAASIEMVLYL
jgi:ribosomal protein S18 acetylase RimI-like enzyme